MMLLAFRLANIALCLLALAWGQNAFAQTEALELEAQLARMQAEIDALKADQNQAASMPKEASATFSSAAPVAQPSYPSARLTGFFQADAVYFSQDSQNREAVGDVQDGADFRRARLAGVGKAWDNVSYQLEMDFGFPGRPSFMDVWLDIDNVIGTSNLRIGQFRQPFGMDGLTSVKELPFLERALPFAFLPFRQIGAMWYGTSGDERLTYAVSGYRYPTDFFGGSTGEDGGYGLSTRFTGLLIDQQHGVMHIGGGYSFIDPKSNLFAFRNQPEIFVGETGAGVPTDVLLNVPPFVNTGLIPSDNASLFNVEYGFSYGSFFVQSEVFYAVVNQEGAASVTLPGAYAEATYVLTGERRGYNKAAGVFGGITPRCNVGEQQGIGAWEVALRYSHLDVDGTIGDGPGGRLNNLTTGLNWYLNPNTKFQFNYIAAMLDRQSGRGAGSSQANIFAMRAQVQF
ncbi:MAG: porin [bacterium]|nr:porin [bacterium]